MTKRSIVKGHKNTGDKVYMISVAVVLALFSAILILLAVWGIFTSFKSDFDFMYNKSGFPKEWTLSNYSLAWDKMYCLVDNGNRRVYMEEMFLNTVLYAGGCALAATFVPCMMAYLTVRFPCKFSKAVTAFVIIAMILPIVGNLPGEIQMATALGLYDNIWGLWIMKANFLGLYFLVLQGAFKSLPPSLSEAAKLDGAGEFQIFVRVMLPLVRTTLALIFLVKFIEFWNDYQIPLIYLPNHPTISQGLYYFNFSTDNTVATVPVKIAGAMFVLLPILIVFFAFRNKLMGNLTLGGIKE